MAIEIANESSDMFLPLKAIVGALSILIENYDVSSLNYPILSITDRSLQRTTANAEQIKDIRERVQMLGEVLASPVSDRDGEEKARREALRQFVSHLLSTAADL